MKYETHIIIAPVGLFERKDLERIENEKFDSVDGVREALKDENNKLIIHSITDFMDECNNEMVTLTYDWIGYVRVKLNKTKQTWK